MTYIAPLYNFPFTHIRNPGDDATLLFCDDCDKGYHMSCLDPPLNGEPDGEYRVAPKIVGNVYCPKIVFGTGWVQKKRIINIQLYCLTRVQHTI